MSLVLLNPQIEATDPLTPNEKYWASQGIGIGWKWQAERRMSPMNVRGTPAANVRGMAQGLPGLRRLRMPFNMNFFGTPEYPGPHPEMDAWLKECVAQGFRFNWCQMDGPSQEAGSTDNFNRLHLVWPHAWPKLETLDDWRSWMAPGGTLSQRHIANYQALFDWIDGNTPDMVIDGFEAINEPVSYRRPGGLYGAEHNAEFMGYYVAHVLAIHDFVEARYPGRDFYVGGWAYSTDFESIRTLKLPAYGGKTALEVFRERIPSGPSGQLVWSAHLYVDWMATPYSHAALRRELDRRWSFLMQDRLVITETNFGAGSADWRLNDTLDWNERFLSQIGDWYQERGVGIGWFAAINYSPSKLLTVLKDGEIQMPVQHVFGNFYNVAARADRQGDLTLVARSGEQPLHRISATRGLLNADFDPDAGQTDDALVYTVGFGGLGVCVLRGHDDANNFLLGGEGRTILYGGALDDFLYLGPGGGVIRTGPGHSACSTNGGQNLIYTGPGQHHVTCIHGSATIVCDPAGVTRVFGFDPNKGDRLSFRGAFATGDDLRVASVAVAARTSRPTDVNVEITTPQGGKVILMLAGNLLELVRFYCLDLTDGWFGPGWVEPVDYTPAEFATPMAPVPPVVIPGSAAQPTGAGPKDAQGRAVVVRDARGQLVNFRGAA